MSYKTAGGSDAFFLNIDTAATDTELVAAVTGKRIRVHALVLTTKVTQEVSIQSDGSSDTKLMTFQYHFETSGGVAPLVLPFSEVGWTETLTGEALDLRTAGTDPVDGALVYSIQNV